ncbi:MAG TPA: hypothetical protein VK071_04600 [Tissierellales bacterium]|nr:hypothetical protein [Tissierellales bacterium]
MILGWIFSPIVIKALAKGFEGKLVKLFFERGAFDQKATYITYQALVFY